MIDALIESHYEIVFRRVYAAVKHYHDAEEVTQTIFINAHKGKHNFRGESTPASWLYSITSMEILQYYRREKAKIRPYLDGRDFDTIPNAEYQVKGYEMQDPIERKLFRGLRPAELRIIALAYQGHSIKYIAVIEGLTVPAIKSRLHRIRVRIEANRRVLSGENFKAEQKAIKEAEKLAASMPKTKKRKPQEQPPLKLVHSGKPDTWDQYFDRKAVVNG